MKRGILGLAFVAALVGAAPESYAISTCQYAQEVCTSADKIFIPMQCNDYPYGPGFLDWECWEPWPGTGHSAGICEDWPESFGCGPL